MTVIEAIAGYVCVVALPALTAWAMYYGIAAAFLVFKNPKEARNCGKMMIGLAIGVNAYANLRLAVAIHPDPTLWAILTLTSFVAVAIWMYKRMDVAEQHAKDELKVTAGQV